MSRGKLFVQRVPQRLETPEQTDRQRRKRAEKAGREIRGHKRSNGFINKHPRGNSFEKVLSAPRVKSASRRGKVFVKHFVTFEIQPHRFSLQDRLTRRRDNRAMKLMKQRVRRRYRHGRVGVS